MRLFLLPSLVCLGLGLILAGPSHAFTLTNPLQSCPDELPSATIQINLALYDPPVYQNYSIGELTRFPTATQSPYPSDALTHTYGLTRNPMRFISNSRVESVHNPLTKKVCYWYSAINLTLEVKPQIYMGKEIKPGSCYYKAVLKHELQHANIERKLLADYQPIITETIKQFVANIGFTRDIPEGQDDVIYKRYQDLIEKQMDVIHQHMEPVRRARQAEIDTLQSYEATSAECRDIEKPPL